MSLRLKVCNFTKAHQEMISIPIAVVYNDIAIEYVDEIS